MAVRNYYGHF